MGFWGIGKMSFYFWRTREQMPPFAGNRGTKALFGNREHKMFFLLFLRTWVQANLFQGNKG